MKKFDPRTILLSTCFLIIALVMANSYWKVVVIILFIATHIFLFKLNLKDLVKILKYSAPLFISVIFVNYFFFSKSTEYIFLSLFRILGIIFLSVSILSSIDIIDIGYAIEKILLPLEKIKIPVGVISTVFAISLKFIPLLKEESSRILLAQRARGIDFELMNLKEKLKNIPTLFLPVIISGIHHSINLATAMEVRGYGYPGKKTRYYESFMEKKDYIYLILSSIPVIIFL